MKRVTVENIIATLKELKDWSPEGDGPDFDRLLKTIEYNVKVGQYDLGDTILEFH